MNIIQSIVNNTIPSYKIWEDEHFLAFLDINPINKGHTLLVPKVGGDYLFELDDEVYGALMLRAKFLSHVIKEALDAPRVGIAVEGFGIAHVHVHFVPLYNGNELNPLRAKAVGDEILQATQTKILKVLEQAC